MNTSKKTMSKKFRILCIDGGGVKGIVPVLILQHIEHLQRNKIHKMFDMISGTSVGGIIASGLLASSNGTSPDLNIESLVDICSKDCKTIFPPPVNFIIRIQKFFTSLWSPRYSPCGLTTLLCKHFGDMKLSNSLKPLVIPSYDVMNQEVIVFKSRKSNEVGHNALLSDVCLATSAAPTYYPAHKMIHGGKLRLFIDGGIHANNPAMIAISEAIKAYGILPQDIELLSIGTGLSTSSPSSFRQNMGFFEWALKMLNVVMDATSEDIVYQSDYIAGKKLRLQVLFPCEVDFTDTSLSTYKIMKKCVQDQIIGNMDVTKQINDFFS